MKSDIDRIMEERGLQTLFVVIGNHVYSPPLDYLIGRIELSGGMAVKKRGEAPVLVVNPMEVQEAGHSGLQVISFTEMGMPEIVKETGGDVGQTQARLWSNILRSLNIAPGKVGVYGTVEINHYLELFRLLGDMHPEYTFTGDMGVTIFEKAYLTKDADELTRIRSVAQRTSAVVRATWDFISSHRANGSETVIKADNSPLTIGDVKRFVRRELLDRELDGGAMIFAQGHESAFPHSRGEDTQALQLGQTIVFDLFPYELGGGYYHDMTRTWCIGYASEAARQLHQTVQEAFDIAVESFRLDRSTSMMQEAVLNFFEQRDHPTTRSHPGSMNGYVHSLGHGLGLNIHENPRITHVTQDHIFQRGNVITIEPGLYYPDEDLGCRIEDTFYISEYGELISLTDVHKDLILPLRG